VKLLNEIKSKATEQDIIVEPMTAS
jgi:hypothetical protein